MTDTVTYQPRAGSPPRRRANLYVGTDQLAALLNLPADVTVAAFTLDWLRDAVAFSLAGDRFDVVPQGCEAPQLVAELALDIAADGTVTKRTTWEGLEGAEIITRHGGDHYRHRQATVRARQWLGDNEIDVLGLCPSFWAIGEEDRGDDPDATASAPVGPNGNRGLMYDTDWIVKVPGGWKRYTDEEFVADFEPTVP